MIAADKQLEALRKEHKELTDNIKRTAILMLTVCSLITISFARACKKTSGSESRTTLCQIRKANNLAGGGEVHISYVFELFQQTEDCPMPCQSSDTSSSSTANTQQQQSSAPVGSTEKGAVSDEAGKKLVAAECQAKLEADIEEKARNWFSVEPPIPGVKVSIDLRYWIFCLPVVFFLSGVYLHTLNRKLRLLRYLGAFHLKKAAPEDVGDLDQLYFSEGSPFLRFPARMLATLFVGIYLYLPIYLAYVGVPLWKYLDTSSLLMIGALIGAITFYCVSYAHLATVRIDQEIVRLTDLPAPPNFISRLLEKAKKMVRWLAARVNPRIPLLSGSGLLLLTLFLTVSESGCEEVVKHKGYEVVLGRATWAYLSTPVFGNLVENQLARFCYFVLLLTALCAIVVALTSRLFSWFKRSRLRKHVYAFVGCIFVSAVLDFSLIEPTGWPKVLLWLLTVGVWLLGLYSLKDRFRLRWLKWRPAVLVIYSPLFLLAIWQAYDTRYLRGLPVFLAGITLMMLALVQLQWLLTSGDEAISGKPPP